LEVGDRKVKLSSKEGGEEEEMQVGLTVWAAGTRPVPFVDTLLNKLPECARGVGGRIEVDKWTRCCTGSPESFGSIMVLGDAASFREKGEAVTLPQTAQVAGQQGAYAARLLCRGYDMTVTPPRMQGSGPVVNATQSSELDDKKLVSTWGKASWTRDCSALFVSESGTIGLRGWRRGSDAGSSWKCARVQLCWQRGLCVVAQRLPGQASSDSQSCLGDFRLDQELSFWKRHYSIVTQRDMWLWLSCMTTFDALLSLYNGDDAKLHSNLIISCYILLNASL